MTKDQIQAAQRIGLVVLETIDGADELGAPGGVLYAGLMTQGCTLNQFQSLMGTLQGRGFVRLEGECYHVTASGKTFIQVLQRTVASQQHSSATAT